jgi:hypothetical protein
MTFELVETAGRWWATGVVGGRKLSQAWDDYAHALKWIEVQIQIQQSLEGDKEREANANANR